MFELMVRYDVEEGEHVLSVQMHGWAYPSVRPCPNLLRLTHLTLTSAMYHESTHAGQSTDHSQLLITVPTSGDPHVQIHHPSRLPVPTSSPSLPYPIALHALGKEDYYTSKTGVNILAMLKSPMVLMMLASGVMMFVLPKIMASVEADPEMKKEMAEARKMMSGAG